MVPADDNTLEQEPELPDDIDSIAMQMSAHRIRASLFGAQASTETTIADRFVLRDRLGSGGMGTVWRAYDEQLGRLVAIKFLINPSKGEARLLREAQALAQLAHPHVIPVFDFGNHEGRVWVAMEYVRGRTARIWVRDAQPPAAEILRQWIAVGRGLAAVHAAGLVHRDLKPDNVLIGDDDRARLIDFGLVRVASEPVATFDEELLATARGDPTQTVGGDEPSVSGPAALDQSLTERGAILGTPAYMAPEQLRGGSGSQRSDQFAFCLSVVESLIGVRPFAMSNIAERLDAIEAQAFARPLPAALPQQVRSALRRGLEADPDRRWPGMSELLDALERGFVRRRRRRLWSLGALATASLAGLLMAIVPTRGAESPTCEITAEVFEGSWDDEHRAALRATFEATGHPYASKSASWASARLDRWTTDWLDTQRSACEAARVEGVQSEQLLDRRSVCLERARLEFDALLGVLLEADPGHTSRALEILAELPRLSRCSAKAQLERLSSAEPNAGALAELAQVARGRALVAAGDYEAALAVIAKARAAAEVSGDAHTLFAAHALQAQLELARGRYDEGLPALREAADEAARAGWIDDEASLRTQLAFEVMRADNQPELARWWLADAEIALARVAGPEDLRWVELLRARGLFARSRGDYQGARALFEDALARVDDDEDQALLGAHLRSDLAALDRKLGDLDAARRRYGEITDTFTALLGPEHPELGIVASNVAVLETDAGNTDRATATFERARDLIAASWGPDTIHGLRAEFGLVRIAIGMGRLDEARASLDELLPRFEASVGEQHRDVAQAYNARGILAFHAGDYEGSLRDYERALAGFTAAHGEDHDDVGLVHANMGESLAALARYDEALLAFARGLDILERRLGRDHPYLGPALKGRGLARLETGATAAAVDDLERALALLEASGDEALELADTRFVLARALRANEGDAGRISELARAAELAFVELGLEPRAEAVRSWQRR